MFIAFLLSIVGSHACSSPMTPSKDVTVYDNFTSGVTSPTVVRDVKPAYTAEAIRNGVQGTVILAAVVLSDGTVGDVTVLESLDTVYGLDLQAVIAAKQWLFTPGLKDGVPVAVRVKIAMSFRLA